ncbi:MAG TPA: hypothetical protein VMR74_10435 [Gammaproteobacteria bacterium]|nr:hypothetical protein [Gammaproteobacteria bacterium]
MKPDYRPGTLLLSSLAFAAACTTSAVAQPDISGVWQAYASVAAPGTGQAPALTEAGAERVDAFFLQYDDDMPEPGWYCVPPGLPATMTSMVSYPIEIIQSSGRITMIAELDMQLRRIYLDGREFPPDNYWPTRMGYSIGHWEDETLLIETRNLSDYLMRSWPRTENTRVVERVYRANRDEADVVRNGFPEENDSIDLLVFEITVTDETLYREAQQITMYYQRVSDAEFLEYDCASGLWEEALEQALD